MIFEFIKNKYNKSYYEDNCVLVFCLFFIGVIFGLVLLFYELPTQIPLWTILVGGFVMVEIIYWLTPIKNDKKKSKKKEDTFKKALKLKLSCILDVLCFIGLTQLLYSGIKRIDLEEILDALIEIAKLFGIIFLGMVVVIGIGWLWIKLNERKFKK